MGPLRQGDRTAAGRLQAGSQHIAEAGTFFLVHGRECLTGARAAEKGAPEILEVGEGAFNGDHIRLDVAQTGGSPKVPKRLKAGGLRTGGHGCGTADRAQGFRPPPQASAH
jgi:hypothetical protein